MNIRYSSRSFLGLIALGIVSFCPLSAKEIFNAPLGYPSKGFDYTTVKTVSFLFSGHQDIDVDAMVKSLAKGKVDVIVTGKTSLEGEAMSPGLSTYVVIERNIKEKSWLVTINTCVNGVATKGTTVDGEPYRSSILVAGDVLVFIDATEQKEVERAIAAELQKFVDKLTTSSQTKPKLFVVH